MDEISSLGEYVAYPVSSREEALQRVADCEVLIVNKVKVDDELMAAAPRLKLICVAATGVNNIDLQAAESRESRCATWPDIRPTPWCSRPSRCCSR